MPKYNEKLDGGLFFVCLFVLFLFYFLTVLHGTWDPSFHTRDSTHALYIGIVIGILNHWTTGEVP